jgi:predicted transposase/invertase (TIGR01784 family)
MDSDLIYKLKLNGSDVYFYILVELQSSVDFTMPFRLLKYMVALLDKIFQKADPNARGRKDYRLPAVVPIILYNGCDAWTSVRTFREYTENWEVFGGSIINFEYLLFDLKRTDEETILSSRRLLDIIFALDQNRISKNDFDAVAERLGKINRDLAGDDLSALSKWAKYVIFKGKVPPDFEENFIKYLTKGDGNTMKHALEIWADEWREDGMAEGMAKGMAKGERKAKLDAARKMLAYGDDTNKVAEVTGLTIDDVLRLQQ